MYKTFFFPGVCVFLLISIILPGCSTAKTTGEYVVVLSLDGFRSDYIGKAKTPTLDSLAKVGVKSAFRPSFPSVTFPNHYTLATGLHPDHHGLVNNFFYAPDLDLTYRLGDNTAVTNPDFYGGEPIWNTAEKQGVKTGVYFWVGSEAPVQKMWPSICKPYDKSIPYTNRADSVISWLERPKKERPRLVMWYIEEPDGIGHSATPEGVATYEMIEKLDSVLNYYFTKARKLKDFKKIDFIVLSDHGMATYYPDKYVNLNDYLPRDSFDYVFDGVPTLLYPKKSYVDSALAILQNVPHIKAYKKDEVPEQFVYRKNPRIGDIVVIPDIGTYVQFRPESRPRLAATHGYDNFAPEMEAIFYAAGPSFKKNTVLPVMANVNLYLIIANLLNLDPAPNDGDIEVVKKLFK
ncbi:putative AlkP superfamily pyrophosphatase or phosphodiesterase [Parabacteroides sp. PF5-5]|uniref:alkaline phosphatase family protein n=1 Tax=unclassified Parabacteroides TaxID=2649774 RepID=UPI00247658C7|nr:MULTISPECIES: ectonucleotide pyrophosphatase/phosphodiesterase [unclassified Parabacteroides]MDH6316695.1 putative AlkP superfamily pyrophosphatase or phosphodiesterase [Parabacteroides sp. PF5-13]MDH6327802.1 putative AlkP superfamily pyrophosphatase or phosphodiesterase [Parabacteroides sp. PH5-41]MDH6335682.1 putative AlkP superfamily pyrophosphatase or phosphodiesterase [Parabacteroides sp. PF5-5]MDH6346666.1 putative AlkP superfamily pyrophosphatase or phosphodiesterase [Parabacteroides